MLQQHFCCYPFLQETLENIPAADAYKFALKLMDYYFTREEMAESAFQKKIRTSKPLLNVQKVTKILSKE